jgi:glutaredoxin
MPSLWRRIRGWFSASPRNDLRVVAYTRANCPLCDKAAEFLTSEQKRFGFALVWVDIANDSELTALHGDWIPVVEINGTVRFRGRINPVLWRRLIR